MKKYFFIVLIILSAHVIQAQVTFSGYVSDCATGERLTGANVYEKETMIGTETNAFGFFSLKFSPTGKIKLTFSYIGYQKKELILSGIADTVLNICLIPGNELKEVRVTGGKNILDKPEISSINLPISRIRSVPALGGEPDVIKVLQLMPGVQSGDEGKSGLYVYGGSPDQNLILLDDVPLYYVNHLGGFVSTFNVDALSSLKLIKGGFPARYGSRLSSVVDVRMKEGNMKEFHGAGTIGMISVKLMLEGPIKKDTLSYLVSFRRFMYDLFMRPVTYFAFKGFTTGYFFYDFNAKLNYKPNKNNRFYFSFYGGDDKYFGKIKLKSYNQKAKLSNKWGNLLGAFRWNHVFSPELFSNTTLTYTRYRYSSQKYDKNENIENKFNFISAIRDINGKFDLEYYPVNALKIRVGLNGIIHKYIPTSTSYKQIIDGKTSVDTLYDNFVKMAYEWNAYMENEFSIGRYLSANVGLRYSNYHINDTSFYSLEPRVVLNMKIAKNTSVKLAYSYMQQYIHLLTSSGAGMSVDYWVPSTSVLPPERAEQYGIEVSHIFKELEISIEGYYKKMSNLITFSEGIGYLGGSGDWQSKVDNRGEGTAYGTGIFINKPTGRFTGWLSYTWSKSIRRFEQQNFGNPYPYKYDRRHHANINVAYKINDRINVSATWVFGTGNPVTLPLSHHYVIDDNDYLLSSGKFNLSDGYEYGGKNSFRMRNYHRLDVGVNFTKKKRWGERTWNISIYNLYNRQNPYYYYLSPSKEYLNQNSTDASLHVFQQSLFPIMPSLAYSFKF